MRSGVTAAGVFLIILGFGSWVVFPSIGGSAAGGGGAVGGFGLAVLTSGIMVLLGFVLLIAGLAASPPQEQSEQKITVQQPAESGKEKSSETETLAICPECKSRIPADTKFCPECGEDLRAGGQSKGQEEKDSEEEAKENEAEGKEEAEPEAEKEEEQETETEEETEESPEFCMYCGTELPSGTEYCPECGEKVG